MGERELGYSEESLHTAVRLLLAGELVAFPTETVYGLGARIDAPAALQRLYSLKGRPVDKPIALLVPDVDTARGLAASWSTAADRLASTFWPGPLTLVVEATAEVPEIIRAGGSTVGLRVPGHAVTLELLRRVGRPLATPSANPSGLAPPTCANDVRTAFADREDSVYILDGGTCSLRVASTVVDVSSTPRILREGAVESRAIEACLHDVSSRA